MAKSACPNCFGLVETSQLAYQCSGRGVEEKRCEPAEDDRRVQRTGSHALSYPTFMPEPGRGVAIACLECGGPAKRRACPLCHTIVPESFVDSDSPMLGIVGSKSSGKTVYMTVLTRQLRENVGKRFNASVRFATDNPDGFNGVAEYTKEREDHMFVSGSLPSITVQNSMERRRSIVLRWQSEAPGRFGGSRLRSTMLSFVDSAGEDFNKLEDAFSLEYLTVCDGLMVALDPFALPGARAQLSLPDSAIARSRDAAPLDVIDRFTEILRTENGIKAKKRIKLPLAVVFTKMDAFFPILQGTGNPMMEESGSTIAYNDADGQNVHEAMRALLAKWNADDIDLYLRQNYDNFRLFGVSALGAEPIYDEDRVDPRGVRPHRVEDPFLWLLAKEGAVKSL